MKKDLICLTYASHDTPAFRRLKFSLDRLGIPYDTEGDPKEYKGWGTKMLGIYRMLKRNQGKFKYFVAVDAYDVIFLTYPVNLKKHKFLISAERNCYPDSSLADRYPPSDTPYRFVNAGTYGGEIDFAVSIFERCGLDKVDPAGNDQLDLTLAYLDNVHTIDLDRHCEVFQTMGFAEEDDFDIHLTAAHNKITGTMPAIWHGNAGVPMDDIYAILDLEADVSNIWALKMKWEDTRKMHKEVHEVYSLCTEGNAKLRDHRFYIEEGCWGFGERSFHWMWYQLIRTLPASFSFLEIGVYRGQVVSLIGMLARMFNKDATIVGVTPLDSTGVNVEFNYLADIHHLIQRFAPGTKNYSTIKGLSTNPHVVSMLKDSKFDVLYIDGGHEYETVKSDIINYGPMVKPGGYLVMDDSCSSFQVPDGMFSGIHEVTKAVDELLPPKCKTSTEWEFMFNVVHNRVYRKKF